MARVRGVVCAGAALLLAVAAGCSMPSLLQMTFLGGGPEGQDRVVVGSLDVVAQSTADSLQQLGIQTHMTEEDQAIRIACTTRRGSRFFLVLTRVETAEGEQTRIHLDLESSKDGEVAVSVLGQLDVAKAK